MEKRLLSLIDERKEELFALLSSLIQIDTQNFDSHGLEMAIVPFLKKEAERLGCDVDVYSPLDIEGFTELEDSVLFNSFSWVAVCTAPSNRLFLTPDLQTVGLLRRPP